MSYQVIFPRPVQKQLDELPDNVFKRVITKLDALQKNPHLPGSIKLRGYKNEYRLRIGSYRIRYEIIELEKKILILHCKHRKDIYKK